MSVSFKYWDECVDPEDMDEMWKTPEVSSEWLDAGETRGQKVHLSRDPDGQTYMTQTEMKVSHLSNYDWKTDFQPNLPFMIWLLFRLWLIL